MIAKDFMKSVGNSRTDVLQAFLDILAETGSRYCVIGGLAVNAYAEPVVSLDLDMAVAAEDLPEVCKRAEAKGFTLQRFEHSLNLAHEESDFRIQLQTDDRYQEFIPRATTREVMGYKMNVAALEDVLRGKIWAVSHETPRKSKRQKDLADIARLVESFPELKGRLPSGLLREVE